MKSMTEVLPGFSSCSHVDSAVSKSLIPIPVLNRPEMRSCRLRSQAIVEPAPNPAHQRQPGTKGCSWGLRHKNLGNLTGKIAMFHIS